MSWSVTLRQARLSFLFVKANLNILETLEEALELPQAISCNGCAHNVTQLQFNYYPTIYLADMEALT